MNTEFGWENLHDLSVDGRITSKSIQKPERNGVCYIHLPQGRVKVLEYCKHDEQYEGYIKCKKFLG